MINCFSDLGELWYMAGYIHSLICEIVFCIMAQHDQMHWNNKDFNVHVGWRGMGRTVICTVCWVVVDWIPCAKTLDKKSQTVFIIILLLLLYFQEFHCYKTASLLYCLQKLLIGSMCPGFISIWRTKNVTSPPLPYEGLSYATHWNVK